jgi:hypothetical protein
LNWTKEISNILIVCDEKWGPMWMSKHHYAHELALLGYDVYFVNPPESWTPKNFFTKPKIEKIGAIKVITINNKYPIGTSISKALRNDRVNLKLLRKEGILNDKSLVWNFDGRRFSRPSCKMIYHIADHNKSVLLDDLVSKNSDLIVCTSERFLEGYQNVRCPKIVIPHGISAKELIADLNESESIKKQQGKFLIAIGTFSDRNNLELLKLTADSFPEHTLLLLGQDNLGDHEGWQTLIQSKNVSYLGVVPAKELKNYISAAALCLTCYRFDHAALINSGAASSLKNMNYLAQNKVTISTLANDIEDFQDQGIYSATNDHDFISLIKKGLNNELAINSDLIQTKLKDLLYPKLILQILNKLLNKSNAETETTDSEETINGKNILLVSNEPWGDIWYSKQNYAYELSKNNNIIFVDPVERWRPKSLFSAHITATRCGDNLAILKYRNAIPVRTSFLDRWNNKITSRRLKKHLVNINFHNHIHWTFDPFRLYDPKLLDAVFSIYHCVDLYGFNYYGENQIATNSDIMFFSSKEFFKTYVNYSNKKVLLPHGISLEEFKIDPIEAAETSLKHTNYGLYIGVIDNRVDFELLEKALIKFKDVKFLFVGPLVIPDDEIAHSIFIEKKYSNLIAIGPVHFKKLKFYISLSNFCISFMDTKIEDNMIAHHKSLLYLSHGKATFGPEFSEYEELNEILYMSNDHNKLLNLIEGFLAKGEPSELSTKRIDYAKGYTFENLLKQANHHIKDLFE